MRPIDGDALKEYVKIFNIGCGCDDDHYERFLDAIDDAPTIESERETGKWIKDEERSKNHVEPIFVCSACNNHEAWGVCECTNYCPNCGSKMEGTECN